MNVSKYVELPKWFLVQVQEDSTFRIFATKITDEGTIIGTTSTGKLAIVKNYEIAVEE
jgi:hypothetical protein